MVLKANKRWMGQPLTHFRSLVESDAFVSGVANIHSSIRNRGGVNAQLPAKNFDVATATSERHSVPFPRQKWRREAFRHAWNGDSFSISVGDAITSAQSVFHRNKSRWCTHGNRRRLLDIQTDGMVSRPTNVGRDASINRFLPGYKKLKISRMRKNMVSCLNFPSSIFRFLFKLNY